MRPNKIFRISSTRSTKWCENHMFTDMVWVSQLFTMKKIFRYGFRADGYQFFVDKFLNRVDIRNFHECYPLF